MVMSIRMISLAVIILLLSSCGFKPIYYSKNSDQKNTDYNSNLILVKVKKYRSNIDYKLHKNLVEILNPYNIDVEKKYFLDVKLTSKTSSTFTTSTGSSGRNKVTLIANYKLLDIESNDILGSGKISESGDFDIERKRFANYITEEQTRINLTKLIARDVRNMIINDLTK